MPPGRPSPPRRTAWLSQGLESLPARLLETAGADVDFDIVVVGSGYGGAVAAAGFAGCRDAASAQPVTVCLLERGREYLEGAFPERMADLAGHVRFSTPGRSRPRGVRTGLFDLRLGPDACALVANGLGGGSLINAGVMEPPQPAEWQRAAWPPAIRGADMPRWIERAQQVLGARSDGQANTWPDPGLPKQALMAAIGRAQPGLFRAPAITLAVRDGHRTTAGLERTTCVRCGDCATGCNHGAKESLDTNLLVQAWSRGAQIFSGATVLKLLPPPADARWPWTLQVQHTDPTLRRRQHEPFAIRARRVVLAAGTFGSTEILLRSRSNKLPLSPRLGTAFSGNGDMISALVGLPAPANAVADETAVPNRRNVGPTITAMLDGRDGGEPVVVQELAIPGPLRRLLEESTAMAASLHALAEADTADHDPRDRDPLAVDAGAIAKTMVVAQMGHDSADGTLVLAPGGAEARNGDGAATVVWPHARDDERLDRRHERLATWLAVAGMPHARVLPNPVWRLLPKRLESLLGQARGPLFTVHPLGGCPMGADAYLGVVDDCGRVYVGPKELDELDEPQPIDPAATYQGLVVLDGAIVPASLGINPALTITALALRAVDRLRADWQLALPPPGEQPIHEVPAQRPVVRPLDPAQPPLQPRRTRIEVIERLQGPVALGGAAYQAELTLHFEPCDIDRLIDPDPALRRLDVRADLSRLRLFEATTWECLQQRPDLEKPDARAAWILPVTRGSLHVMQRAASTPCRRRRRALWPWFRNRGLRDIWHTVSDRLLDRVLARPAPPAPPLGQLARSRAAEAWRLLTRAGEIRLFDYDLEFGPAFGPAASAARPPAALQAPSRLRGQKRLTYARRGNPWRQLARVHVEQAPFSAPGGGAAQLDLDLHYLTRRELPLLRIVDQQDQPTALVDLVRLAGWFMRIVLHVHTWSFRKPDPPHPRVIDRLPGRLPGLPEPEVVELAVDRAPGARGAPVRARLTRYRARAGANPARPVLLIHGYSTSGNAFAHPAVERSLARHLHDEGFDVWIVDLRTSSGMPTARTAWSFEQVAYADIPLAVDHIVAATGVPQIDVVAHCMGAAMLCMALLGDTLPAGAPAARARVDPHRPLREALPRRIRRLVLSQVTPRTLFSQANLFRAYLMRYVRHFLDLDGYAFRPEPDDGAALQLLDRLLATLPYPEDEFDRENPWLARTPWVGTRHRMDALYGRDFRLANMSDAVLAHIDDQFGPLSIDTISQALHFARRRELTDRDGDPVYLSKLQVDRGMPFPVLSLHGSDNGLADPATKPLMEGWFRSIGKTDYEAQVIPDHGHQDCLIGTRAHEAVFPRIVEFLRRS